MPTNLTPPTDPLNFITRGDMDIFTNLNSDMGNGTVYVRDGGLYVNGLTDLNATTIDTSTGELAVYGTNRVQFDITNAIEFTATNTSFFKTTAGTLTLWTSATDSNGKIDIKADGTGTNSILIEATNATSGQVTVQSAGGSSSTKSVQVLATDTTNGQVLIQGAGNFAASNPAVKIAAPNATSGQISITSAGDDTSSDAVTITATGTTGGNVLIQGAGSNGSAVKLYSTSAGGKLSIVSDGTATDTVTVTAGSGGMAVSALKQITIQSADVTNGVSIATATSGVPVNIGTSTSLTTISGDLIVQGTTTSLATETLTVKDNVVVLNAGNGELGIDAGLVTRRYQTANGASTGDVITTPGPVQETHFFAAGSATPGTLVFCDQASSVDDFYKGWWIKITSGTASGTVRRIKSYVGATKTATIYVTADNVVGLNAFSDGLDLTAAPAAADTFSIYSASYIASFYSESQDEWTFATVAKTPDAIGDAGISVADVQQYQNIKTGGISTRGQTFKNVPVANDSGRYQLSLLNHGLVVGDKVRLTTSQGITPALTDGVFTVLSNGLTTDVFEVAAPASFTVDATSSVTCYIFKDAYIKVNTILPADGDYGGISIPGLSSVEDINIPKTSTANFDVTSTTTYGSYLLVVSDISGTGACATFAVSSSGTGGSVSRISSSKGTQNQRLDAAWSSGNKVQIKHAPAGSGSGNYTYRVRIVSAI
jgi:hypothetical protein